MFPVHVMFPVRFIRLLHLAIPAALVSLSPLAQAAQSFWVQTGSSSPYDQVLSGTTAADHANGSNFSGYIGEIVMIPTDQSVFTGLPPNTPGTLTIPSSGPFADTIGLVAFCIDSMVSLASSADTTQVRNYRSYNNPAAESRYLAESVTSYLPGGLLRAAYLLETFFDNVNDDIGGAALQAVIWEVLYDANPNLNDGQGNYYIRTGVGATETAVAALGNDWLSQAAASNWGGPGYDPASRVIFWLDPDDTENNQSLMTLNPANFTIEIPEPSTSILLIGSIALAALRRKR